MKRNAEPRRSAITPPTKPKPTPGADFKLGDRVQHRAFGEGIITRVSPMGGDALLEITFETQGLKRLMLRAAGQFMKKLD